MEASRQYIVYRVDNPVVNVESKTSFLDGGGGNSFHLALPVSLITTQSNLDNTRNKQMRPVQFIYLSVIWSVSLSIMLS